MDLFANARYLHFQRKPNGSSIEKQHKGSSELGCAENDALVCSIVGQGPVTIKCIEKKKL